MGIWDLFWIVFYLIAAALAAWKARQQSVPSLKDYFSGGGNMAWAWVGLSMVATTFSADTPLAVTGIVRTQGISGNWLWWNMLLGGILTTYFFARLWRRAGVLTDLEFITLRYSGREARFLRRFKALYFGLFINLIIMAWVNVALRSVLEVFLGLNREESTLIVLLFMSLTAVYVAWTGLRGVIYTDAIQFVIAMGGAIFLAVWVLGLDEVGGLQGIRDKLSATGALNFMPSVGEKSTQTAYSIGWPELIAFMGLQWWASWYPGAEPGGGGYIAQRMLSTKNEGSAQKSILLFQCLHYAARPLPWIIVALASLILYPTLGNNNEGQAYLMTMRDYLPAGMNGLLLVGFLSAYMSTISTHLNWGASYIINDFVKTLKPTESTSDDAGLIRLSKWVVWGMIFMSAGLSLYVDRIETAWQFLLECGAGAGGVLILRWYWWRVSAWSELAATVLPFVFYGLFRAINYFGEAGNPDGFFVFPNTYFLTVGMTTIGWLAVTYLTPATDPQTLDKFDKQVRPKGWWPNSHQHSGTALWVLAIAWLATTAGILGLLAGATQLLLGDTGLGVQLLVLTLICLVALYFLSLKYKLFGDE